MVLFAGFLTRGSGSLCAVVPSRTVGVKATRAPPRQTNIDRLPMTRTRARSRHHGQRNMLPTTMWWAWPVLQPSALSLEVGFPPTAALPPPSSSSPSSAASVPLREYYASSTVHKTLQRGGWPPLRPSLVLAFQSIPSSSLVQEVRDTVALLGGCVENKQPAGSENLPEQ